MTASTGPFGSTCATATCSRHPISAKLNPISAMTVRKAASTRIEFASSLQGECCPEARYQKPSHNVILIPQSREKNLRLILPNGNRLEMFRFVQHNSAICEMSSKLFASVECCLGLHVEAKTLCWPMKFFLTEESRI